MSQAASPDFLLDTRGDTQETGAFVVSAAFDRAGAVAAFALGDGTLRLVSRAEPSAWRTVEALFPDRDSWATQAATPWWVMSPSRTGPQVGRMCTRSETS